MWTGTDLFRRKRSLKKDRSVKCCGIGLVWELYAPSDGPLNVENVLLNVLNCALLQCSPGLNQPVRPLHAVLRWFTRTYFQLGI